MPLATTRLRSIHAISHPQRPELLHDLPPIWLTEGLPKSIHLLAPVPTGSIRLVTIRELYFSPLFMLLVAEYSTTVLDWMRHQPWVSLDAPVAKDFVAENAARRVLGD